MPFPGLHGGFLDIGFEGRIWRKAADVFGTGLQKLLEEGLNSFKRQPGLDHPMRLHVSYIGTSGMQALRAAMTAHVAATDAAHSDHYVNVRSRLRTHLRRHLQWELIQSGKSVDEATEDYFAEDLGL